MAIDEVGLGSAYRLDCDEVVCSWPLATRVGDPIRPETLLKLEDHVAPMKLHIDHVAANDEFDVTMFIFVDPGAENDVNLAQFRADAWSPFTGEGWGLTMPKTEDPLFVTDMRP